MVGGLLDVGVGLVGQWEVEELAAKCPVVGQCLLLMACNHLEQAFGR